MEIYKKVFGERFRSARKRMVPKMTQADLAEIIGVEPPSISRWETGTDFPDDGRLPAICKALGVPLDYFAAAPAIQPQSDPGWKELSRVIQYYLDSEQDTRLLSLYIMTEDDRFLDQYASIDPEHAADAAVLKRIL